MYQLLSEKKCHDSYTTITLKWDQANTQVYNGQYGHHLGRLYAKKWKLVNFQRVQVFVYFIAGMILFCGSQGICFTDESMRGLFFDSIVQILFSSAFALRSLETPTDITHLPKNEFDGSICLSRR